VTLIKGFVNHLPGDPCKVAEAVLMVTKPEEPPLLKAVRDRLAAFSASIDGRESVTRNVNFAKE
jgi:hypothetical protein